MLPVNGCERGCQKGRFGKHLFACAEQASEHNYKLLKIYMMVGVPGEQEEDLDELIRFAKEISVIHPVAFGVAPFVAKRNTPLDGIPFAGIKNVERRLKYVQKRAPANPRPEQSCAQPQHAGPGRNICWRRVDQKWVWLCWRSPFTMVVALETGSGRSKK